MKIFKLFIFIAAVFSFSEFFAAPNITGSNPKWNNLYYSFDNLAYSTSGEGWPVVDDRNGYGGAKGTFRDLNDVIIRPYYMNTYTSSGHPFKGKAAYLNGSRYIKAGNYRPLMSLAPTHGRKITISLWIKFQYGIPQGNDCFIGKNDSNGGNDFLFGIWDGKMLVQIGNTWIKQTYVDGTNGGIDVYDTDFHHFAVSIEEDSANPGTSDVTLWIDGTKIWNKASLNNVATDSMILSGKWPTIGMELDGTSKTDLLEGYVDEIQIFNDVANDDDIDNLYNGRFGVQSDFDVWTSSIEDYSPLNNYHSAEDLYGSHDTADGFLYNAHSVMNQYYYKYLNAVSTFAHVAKETDVTILNGWMTDSDQNDYEVVFHSGHGRPKGPQDYFKNETAGHVLIPEYFSYSGSTRWVFWHSCHTMRYVAHGWKPCSIPANRPTCCPDQSAGDACYGGDITTPPYFDENEGLNWFSDRFDSDSGPHAIFGFASSMMLFSSGTNGCQWTANYYTPTYSGNGSEYCPANDNNYVLFNETFWNDVIKYNTPIWEAYKDAVEARIWNSSVERFAVEAAIAYRKDPDTGFDGSLEKWNSVFREGTTSSMELTMDSQKFEGCVQWSGETCIDERHPSYN